jgi:hypothetical protein
MAQKTKLNPWELVVTKVDIMSFVYPKDQNFSHSYSFNIVFTIQLTQ